MAPAGMAVSAACSGQMQDRTHRGGAVLWFMRKHCPPPAPFSSLSQLLPGDSQISAEHVSTDQTLSHGASIDAKSSADSPAVPSHSARRPAAPQRHFLHRTLLAIGTELDESVGPRSDHAGVSCSAQAYDHRVALRSRFAEFTDAECAELTRAVAAREAEVASLTRQVQQMENQVAATRAAVERRAVRLRNSISPRQGSAPNGGSSLTSAHAVLRSMRTFKITAGTEIFDVESRDSSAVVNQKAKESAKDATDEFQQNILRQNEIAQNMRAQVDEQVRVLEQQTIHRKAAEAALFCTPAETLHLRARTQKAEARVMRLAVELRRVYEKLPQTIQWQLEGSFAKISRAQKSQELDNLKSEHRHEHFKFMDVDALQEEAKSCDRRIAETSESARVAEDTLWRGRELAESMAHQATLAKEAISSLAEVWTKIGAQAAAAAGDEFDFPHQVSNTSSVGSGLAAVGRATVGSVPTADAQATLQQAKLAITTIVELLALLQQTGGTSATDGPRVTEGAAPTKHIRTGAGK